MMKDLKRIQNESLSAYSFRLSEVYCNSSTHQYRKNMGQFFTPLKISEYMAKLLYDEPQEDITLLDPGAGTGILIASFCGIVLNNEKKPLHVNIDAFELDENLIPLLKETLEQCKIEFNQHNIQFNYKIINNDFILENCQYYNKSKLNNFEKNELKTYNYIIANPPYFKLNKNSKQALALSGLIYGQPNIYFLFMALSSSMLSNNGILVYITPRSFTSGLYYKRFRSWFLRNNNIDGILIFESRNDIFSRDKVLQENIIVRARKKDPNIKHMKEPIHVGICYDRSLSNIETIIANYNDVIYKKNGDSFIRIPTSVKELSLIRKIDKLPFTLNDLGLKISTGPVVAFRAKRYLTNDYDEKSCVPLIRMHNFRNFDVIWPIQNNGKEICILNEKNTKHLLLPVKNYVLLKRFSAKEQKRRLYASVLLKSKFESHKNIGLENHVNYIYSKSNPLTPEQVYGIAAFLNSSIIDQYFRIFNGSTQVNANDIKNLPLPSMDILKLIGKEIIENGKSSEQILEKIVLDKLKLIDRSLFHYNQR